MENNNSYRLYGWGKNISGVLPKEIHKDIRIVSAGENHIIMLTSKGELLATGSNKFGQLGIASDMHKGEKISNVPKNYDQFINLSQDPNFKNIIGENGASSIRQIACGAQHTFIINQKNQIYSMGLNIKGQLGHSNFQNCFKPKIVISMLPFGVRNPKSLNPSLTKGSKPSIVEILERFDLQVKMQEQSIQSLLLLQGDQIVIKISCGALFTVALTNKGRIFGCGYQGIKNNSSKENEDLMDRAKFKEILMDYRVKQVHCGLSGAAALTREGFVFVWGRFGRLVCNYPKRLKKNDTIVSSRQQEEKYQDALIGDEFIVVLTNKGEVYTCGENIDNQLGCGVQESAFQAQLKKIKNIPLVKSIHIGRNHCFAVNGNNQLYGWGSNRYNQIGLSQNYPMAMKPHHLGITLPEVYKIVASSYFTLLLSGQKIVFSSSQSPQKPIKEENEEKISLSEYKKLLHDYQVLKSLNLSLLEKHHPPKKVNMSVQTSSKFDIDGSASKFRQFSSNVEIGWNQLELIDRINQGGYGVIYKAKWREIIVVVKKFKIQNGDVSLRDFLSECNAMEAVRHPNIVMFLGAVTKPKNYSIILQFCKKGSLWTYLQNLDNNIPWDQRKRLAIQIAQGVHYLHECKPPILHRDLKSLNIFLDENLKIKIGDFGWTKTLEEYMTNKIGTYQWMAPEVIGNMPYTEKADIFSYSIILWELASREPPYRNITGAKVSEAVLNNELRPTIPKKTPQPFSRLMKKCWDNDPSKRPNFKQIIRQLEIMKL